ncbi:CHAT domain-containing protein [Streptomyces sp. HUAS MG47]|uniref:CHAT domain-containing protein n=1 Tax=Streptomyces solicamelliae TaxID=3231716 RepID=UPI003877AF64
MSSPVVRIADLLEDAPTDSAPPPVPSAAASGASQASGRPPLTVTVVWGDLPEVPADLHVTGHYHAVLPAAAELALDRAISGGPRRLIAEHTQRGRIDAQLGLVTYFPCKGGTVRSAAVVGMGPLGTLTERRATQLHTSLLGEVMGLGHVRTLATVLIGSGTGNLTVTQAARALVHGFGGALRSQASSAAASRLTEVLVVEIDRLRAEQLVRALDESAGQQAYLRIAPRLREERSGRLSPESAAVYALTALTRLTGPAGTTTGEAGRPDGAGSPAGDGLLGELLAGLDPAIRHRVRKQLGPLAEVDRTHLSLKVHRTMDPTESTVPVRVSALSGAGGLRWAALTERATVPERLVPVDMDLLRQLVDRLTEPSAEDARDLPDLLSRFVVPPDFQQLLTDEATVLLELDQETALVPWEFLADVKQRSGERDAPLAVRTPLSRQLRTRYSRVLAEETSAGPLKALVIGDPGDPEKGFQLPGARAEAVAVAAQLRRLGVEVTLFVGAAGSGRPADPGPPADSGRRAGSERPVDVAPATRLDVLRVLLAGGHHIVHYCGHSSFDTSASGVRSGWVFADGLLTAQELVQLERPPRIVVANACYSSRLADTGRAEPLPGTPWGSPQARLVPSLADEFLRVGVAHYVGAGWRIPDDQATAFSTTFYTHLLESGPGGPEHTVGAAVHAARRALYQERDGSPGAVAGGPRQDPPGAAPERRRNSTWAAYQHYGDPTDPFVRASDD